MTDKKFYIRWAESLEDFGWRLGMGLVVLSLGVLKLFFSRFDSAFGIVTVVALLLFYAYFFWKDSRLQKRTSVLESKLALEEQKSKQLEDSVSRWRSGFDDFFRHSLIFLYNSLGYGESDRISVYEHDDTNSTFKLAGRYSLNPLYSKKGRDSYPDDEGFISKGWHHGEFCHGLLPDPSVDLEAYFEAVQHECNMKKGTLRQISMLSRSYCVHNITTPVTNEKIGIIVLESTEEGKFDGEEAGQTAARINELFNAHIVCKHNC
jgi:hypothetical protein